MGEVFLARRRAAGVEKWLVVKRMRPERAGDARFLDLFMREARLSMSLAHQNIVPVFDFGRVDDQVFLAMERVEGKDLGSTLLKAGAPLSALLVAFIGVECCQALDYAHRRRGPDGAPLGIVHRDVTPRNVLLSWSGEVKLTDFGIAALAGDDARTAIGTPAYMAPEQARGEPCDARSDVYAIGLVLREALTGRRARGGTDREATLALARDGALEAWPNGFASPMRDIIDRATATVPTDRYPDARAMLEDLDHLIVAERAVKKGESPARQLAAWLASTWGSEREETAPGATIDGAIDGGEMVSFLDDGALDVVGTGTQRSMAATAGDEAPPAPAPMPRPKRRPVWLIPAALGAPIAVIIAVVLATGSHEPAPVRAPTPAPAPPPPAVIEEPRPPVVDTKLPVDTKPPVESKPPTKLVKKSAPVVKLTESPAAPVASKRRGYIGAKPYWSSFTVDGDPAVHTTGEPIELTPGEHTFHFTGNPHFAADHTVTLEIPDQDGFTPVVKLPDPN
jgi:serine/threonine-protein kinase